MPLTTLALLLLLFSSLGSCEVLDDAAELDINGTNTNSLHLSESGGGKTNGTPEDSEEKKTLSQQVADGKYGLIQRELFNGNSHNPPGVISYSKNPEIPKDNSDNLGGLNREEIWLAEDHLLVLKGNKDIGHLLDVGAKFVGFFQVVNLRKMKVCFQYLRQFQ